MNAKDRLQVARLARKKAPTRREKMQAYRATFDQIRMEYPKSLLPMIDRAQAGSLKAAVQLKCAECSAFNRTEVALCVITACPLYPHRPFRGKGKK